MPRDASGVFSLAPGISPTPNTLADAAKVAAALEDVSQALTGSLPRDGSAGMLADLPMGGKKITGLADPVGPQDAMTLAKADARFATASHTHTIANVAGLQAAIDGKAPTAHTHAVADVTGLQAALDTKAPLASPALTGSPTAPTPAGGTNTTQIATTAFVRSEVAGIVGGSPAALDTLNELATALGNDPNFATSVSAAIGGKVAKAGDTMTGPLAGTLFSVGGTGQYSCSFAARRNGNSIEWGHTNTGGYGSVLGADAGGGYPFLAFNCGAGSTANTYRTLGIPGVVVKPKHDGGLYIQKVSIASADNQAPTTLLDLSATGELSIVGPNVYIGGHAAWHAGNFNPANYATLIGNNALTGNNTLSGTTSLNGATTSTGQFSAVTNSVGGIGQATADLAKFRVQTNGATDAAFMTFLRSPTFAVYFGVDTDNQLKVGGWSMGSAAYRIWHEGIAPAPQIGTNRSSTGVHFNVISQIPLDDTIPQATEGTEFLAIAYAAKTAASRLRITASVNMSIGSGRGVVSICRDGASDAICAGTAPAVDYGPCILSVDFLPGTTATQTFRLRVGNSNSGQGVYINGNTSQRMLGGVMLSFIKVEEYAA